MHRQYIGAERIPGRNGEIVVAAAAGDDDFHISFCNSCFFDNHFHDFREFIRRRHRADAQKTHGAIQTVHMVGKGKGMTLEYPDPFVAAVAELQALSSALMILEKS